MPALSHRTGTTSVAALLGITLTVAAAHVLAPETSRAAGLDVWNYGSAAADLTRADDRQAELEGVHDRLRRQIAASDAAVAEVVGGRLPLAAALDELEDINRDRAGFEVALRSHAPAVPTHRLRVAGYVVAKVARWAAEGSAAAAAAQPRLAAEAAALTAAP